MKIKTEKELYDMLGSLEKFNQFLVVLEENILRKNMLAVPALVIHHLKNEISYNKIKEDFFKKNPELIPHKPVFAQQLNIVAAEHVDWSIEQVFTQAGIESKVIIKKLLEEKNVKTV